MLLTGEKSTIGIKEETGMKVLGINSSARKDGNTAILMNKVFEVLNKAGIETELVQLAGKAIEPCKACWACGGRENCVHQKDCFREIFEKMKEADGIALLERAAVVGDMNPGLLVHKAGAAVTAARRGGALQAIDTMTHFFLNHEMYVAGSTYWNMGYGQMPGDVENDQEALANMENLGQNMAYLLKALGEGRQ